jgi:hypothetical protein
MSGVRAREVFTLQRGGWSEQGNNGAYGKALRERCVVRRAGYRGCQGEAV